VSTGAPLVRYPPHGAGPCARLAGGNAAPVNRTGPGPDAPHQEDVAVKTRLSLAAALLCCAAVAPLPASADPWKGKHEDRDDARSASYRHYDDDRRDDDRRYDGDRRYYYYDDSRYYGRNDWDRVSHYHPGGQYCRDARHVIHYRDGYYRNGGRWYRDGRYWNETAYVNRYYGHHHHNHDHDDGNDDLYRGIVIGAAIVGVIAAVHEANDGD
jgi:hypothetical protein